MTERHVVILGEARIDEIRDAQGVREHVAGSAVELAQALRGCEVLVTVITPLGDDPDGERIRAVLESGGAHLVPLPAAEGTARRMLVRDRSGAENVVRDAGSPPFVDTRRSLAAQAEADHVVDLRERGHIDVAEERDGVLRALGLGGAPVPADSHGEEVAEASDDEAASVDGAVATGTAGEGPAAGALSAAVSAAPVEPAVLAPTAARTARLLPAPIVAGTWRHAPVRLSPEPPAAHAPAPDWHGLEARLARIAT